MKDLIKQGALELLAAADPKTRTPAKYRIIDRIIEQGA